MDGTYKDVCMYVCMYVWCVYRYKSAIKKNETLPFVTTWVDSEVILLSVSDIHLQKLQTKSHHTYNFKYCLKKEKGNCECWHLFRCSLKKNLLLSNCLHFIVLYHDSFFTTSRITPCISSGLHFLFPRSCFLLFHIFHFHFAEAHLLVATIKWFIVWMYHYFMYH